MVGAGNTAAVSGGTIRRGDYIVTPNGLGEVMGIFYIDADGLPISRPIDASVEGKLMQFRLSEVRKATFRDFAINRTGFGKTSWPQFALVQTMCIGLLVTGFFTPWLEGGWVAHTFFLAVEGVMLYGTWGNFTGRIR